MAECQSCGERIAPKRVALGYSLCLPCGEAAARRVVYTTAPINKSSYMLITNRAELAQLNPKKTT